MKLRHWTRQNRPQVGEACEERLSPEQPAIQYLQQRPRSRTGIHGHSSQRRHWPEWESQSQHHWRSNDGANEQVYCYPDHVFSAEDSDRCSQSDFIKEHAEPIVVEHQRPKSRLRGRYSAARDREAHAEESLLNLTQNMCLKRIETLGSLTLLEDISPKHIAVLICFLVLVVCSKSTALLAAHAINKASQSVIDRLILGSLERLVQIDDTPENVWADHVVFSQGSPPSIDIPATFQSRLNALLAPLMAEHEGQIWSNDVTSDPRCKTPEGKLISFSLRKSPRLPAVITFEACNGHMNCIRNRSIHDVRDLRILLPQRSNRFMFHVEAAEDRPGNEVNEAEPHRYEPWGRYQGFVQIDLSDGGKVALQRYCGQSPTDVDLEGMDSSNVRFFTVFELKRLYKLWAAGKEPSSARSDRSALFCAKFSPKDIVYSQASLAQTVSLLLKPKVKNITDQLQLNESLGTSRFSSAIALFPEEDSTGVEQELVHGMHPNKSKSSAEETNTSQTGTGTQNQHIVTANTALSPRDDGQGMRSMQPHVSRSHVTTSVGSERSKASAFRPPRRIHARLKAGHYMNTNRQPRVAEQQEQSYLVAVPGSSSDAAPAYSFNRKKFAKDAHIKRNT